MNKYKHLLASNNYVHTDWTYVSYIYFPRSHAKSECKVKYSTYFGLKKSSSGLY